jgi:kynurenine formamidase
MVAGADKHPPVIARGILLDIAGTLGVDVLPDSYAIGEQSVRDTLAREGVEVQPGDVVLIRTGRTKLWSDPAVFGTNSPGINREAAEYLAKAGAIMIGADTLTLEQIPSADAENWQGVHTYLLAEAGVPILEVANLEELAKEAVYKFAFVGATLKIRGATGGPMRPIALPLSS